MAPNNITGLGSLAGLGSFTAVAPDSSFIARVNTNQAYWPFDGQDASNTSLRSYVSPTTGLLAFASGNASTPNGAGAILGILGGNSPSTVFGRRRSYISSSYGLDPIGSVLLDSSDNLYVFGEAIPESAGWMAKYNSSGTEQVIRKIGNKIHHAKWNSAKTSIFMLVNGNTLVKIGTDLVTIEWQKTITGLDAPYGSAMGVDSNDNIYFASRGSFSGTTSNLVKIDSTGALVWEKTVTVGGGSSLGYSTHSIDIFGNTFVISNTIAPGNININPFVTKVNSDGNIVWAKSIYKGNGNQEYPRNTGVDDLGNLYVFNDNTSIIKINGSDGSIAFGRTIQFPNSIQSRFGFTVSGSGAFYIYAMNTGTGHAYYAKFTANGLGTGTYTYGTYAVRSGVTSTTSSSSIATSSNISSIATSSLTLSTGWPNSIGSAQSASYSNLVYDTIS